MCCSPIKWSYIQRNKAFSNIWIRIRWKLLGCLFPDYRTWLKHTYRVLMMKINLSFNSDFCLFLFSHEYLLNLCVGLCVCWCVGLELELLLQMVCYGVKFFFFHTSLLKSDISAMRKGSRHEDLTFRERRGPNGEKLQQVSRYPCSEMLSCPFSLSWVKVVLSDTTEKQNWESDRFM